MTENKTKTPPPHGSLNLPFGTILSAITHLKYSLFFFTPSKPSCTCLARKKIKWLSVFPLFLVFAGCSGWTINGIPTEKIIQADPGEYAEMAAGAAGAVLVHWMGHVVYYEMHNIEWEQDGFDEIITSRITDRNRRWQGRAGFLAQLLTGTAIDFSPWSNTKWATGYDMATAAQIITYPVDGQPDFDQIDNGADADIEYAIYSLWSLLLLRPVPHDHQHK